MLSKNVRGGITLLFLCLFSLSAQALTLPPLFELQGPSYNQSVPVKGTRTELDGLRVTASEVTYPGPDMKVLDKAGNGLLMTLKPGKKRGVSILSLSKPTKSSAHHERYFKVSLTNKSNTGSNSMLLTTLVVIPPDPFTLDYRVQGHTLHNNSNGYIVVMEDLACGQQQGRSWLVGPGRTLSLPRLVSGGVLSVGRGRMLREIVTTCRLEE